VVDAHVPQLELRHAGVAEVEGPDAAARDPESTDARVPQPERRDARFGQVDVEERGPGELDAVGVCLDRALLERGESQSATSPQPTPGLPQLRGSGPQPAGGR
ncbi:unnamed protein product, partial [Penicillium discolor]